MLCSEHHMLISVRKKEAKNHDQRITSGASSPDQGETINSISTCLDFKRKIIDLLEGQINSPLIREDSFSLLFLATTPSSQSRPFKGFFELTRCLLRALNLAKNLGYKDTLRRVLLSTEVSRLC